MGRSAGRGPAGLLLMCIRDRCTFVLSVPMGIALLRELREKDLLSRCLLYTSSFVRALDAAKASLSGGGATLFLSKDSPLAQIFYSGQ